MDKLDQEKLHQQQFEQYMKEHKSKSTKKWLIGCGGCLVAFILLIISLSACAIIFGGDDSSHSSDTGTTTSSTNNLKIGDTVKKDNTEVTVTKAEFVAPQDEFSNPENEKILRIHFHMKNNNNDQVLFTDNDFTLNVDGKNYHVYYGGDGKAGFSHQLNKNKTGDGYVDYDVPTSEKYNVEMEATPNLEKITAKWIITNSDIN